jgi:hypothetical protein
MGDAPSSRDPYGDRTQQEIPMPLAQSLVTGAIVGSWYASAPGGGTDQIVFTFFSNGKFMVSDKGTVANDPNGTSGIEWGDYTWNPATGAFTTTFLSNTDGEWGMSHAGTLTMAAAGNTLTVGGGEGSMPLTRLVPVPGSIVGSWYAQYPNDGDLENLVVTFLADGTYLIASEGIPPGPDARDGAITRGILPPVPSPPPTKSTPTAPGGSRTPQSRTSSSLATRSR